MSDQIRKAAVLFAESAAERVKNCSVAGKGLSGRKAPPIPGISAPESFWAALRFKTDSSRSENRPAAPMGTDASAAVQTVKLSGSILPKPHTKTTDTAMEESIPPKNPSQLLFGLISGASACLPKAEPIA